MKASLESEIENCAQEIDCILYSHEMTDNQYIDKMVAHYLDQYGHTDWIYNDEISGPQLNEISEKALTKIVDNKTPYYGQFRIVSEIKNGATYFKTKRIEETDVILTYNQIEAAPKAVNWDLTSLERRN